jgi:hypothetical protein
VVFNLSTRFFSHLTQQIQQNVRQCHEICHSPFIAHPFQITIIIIIIIIIICNITDYHYTIIQALLIHVRHNTKWSSGILNISKAFTNLKRYKSKVHKYRCKTVINYTEHTKFLGLWLDKNIKWSLHTQQLATKLSKICFAIRIIKQVSGLETVRTLYCAYFHSLLLYGLIFWENSANAKFIFRLQKRAIRAMVQIQKSISCKQYFKLLHILPLQSLYIYEILVYIKTNLNEFTTNSEIHTHNTRRKDDLFILSCNMSLCKNNFNNIGIRMLNQLPLSIKEIPVLYKFKRTLKAFLLNHCFYSIDVFLLFGAYPSSNHM